MHSVPPRNPRGCNWAPGALGEDGPHMSQVVLEGPRGVLLTGTDAWGELLAIAHQYGWQPEYPEGHYRADIGLQVAPHDAYGIARALRDAVEFLIRYETTATLPDLPELVGDICETIAFCCDGGFRICYPMSEALDCGFQLGDATVRTGENRRTAGSGSFSPRVSGLVSQGCDETSGRGRRRIGHCMTHRLSDPIAGDNENKKE